MEIHNMSIVWENNYYVRFSEIKIPASNCFILKLIGKYKKTDRLKFEKDPSW